MIRKHLKIMSSMIRDFVDTIHLFKDEQEFQDVIHSFPPTLVRMKQSMTQHVV